MSAWDDLQEEALEKVELAGVYLADGAPRSAARCLRGAANKLEQAANLRDQALAAALAAAS
ncbi:hypothetical protein DFR49_2308 [Hephaestia caeni]|uniref:Uncharacterized protein n=1 Tax=Hephaestia caeni TaxID=645617 RepID=A0A397PEI6_9SPHN|nr:hypothetical protein [Hephaestia caeni]RIA44071.1 hypothetical protein DFR49_2308 [Hephaestia caeni]